MSTKVAVGRIRPSMAIAKENNTKRKKGKQIKGKKAQLF